jgi:hypothetical protein
VWLSKAFPRFLSAKNDLDFTVAWLESAKTNKAIFLVDVTRILDGVCNVSIHVVERTCFSLQKKVIYFRNRYN